MRGTQKCMLFAQVALIVSFAITAVTSEADTESTQNNRKTITRQFDHVVIKGKELKANLQGRIPLMRLYAFKEGTMEPIPFQIDEITEDGDWVLETKSPYLSDKEAAKMELLQDSPPDTLDDNDELVLMITDAGDKAPFSYWPSGWQRADEITLTDPLTNEQAWVYLFSFDSPKKLSPVDYVAYRFPKEGCDDKVYTNNYTLGFSEEVPISWDYITFNDDINVMDRMKIRINASFFKVINLSWNENDLMSRLWQYKDGPVRCIRMVRSSIKLIGKLKSPEISSETLYYKNAVLIPFRVKIFFTPKTISKGVYFNAGADFRDLYGWKARINTDNRWMTIDGKMDDLEKNIVTKGPEEAKWFIIKGPQKAFIISLHMPKEAGLKRDFIYLDDNVIQDPPEFQPAQVPYIGYHVHGLENIPKGTFQFYCIAFNMNKDYQEEELIRAMNVLDNPVKVETRGYKPNISK